MPAYARYCDLHIANDNQAYDFTTEIIDYCRYQIENKRNSVVDKKAVIVLDYVNKWDEVALPLLDRFAKAEVIIQAGFAVAVRKFPAMWNKYKSEKPHNQKKVAIEEDLFNTLSGIKADLVLEPKGPFNGFALKRVNLGVSLTNWTNTPIPDHDPTLVLSGSRMWHCLTAWRSVI